MKKGCAASALCCCWFVLVFGGERIQFNFDTFGAAHFLRFRSAKFAPRRSKSRVRTPVQRQAFGPFLRFQMRFVWQAREALAEVSKDKKRMYEVRNPIDSRSIGLKFHRFQIRLNRTSIELKANAFGIQPLSVSIDWAVSWFEIQLNTFGNQLV